jgi:hypothetical protein
MLTAPTSTFRQQVADYGASFDRLMSTMGYEEDYEPLPRPAGDAIFHRALVMEENPERAVEAVTGVSCWYAEMTSGEVRILEQWANRLFAEAVANGEGSERLMQLDAAATALRWIAERMEETRDDEPAMRPVPYLQGEFI